MDYNGYLKDYAQELLNQLCDFSPRYFFDTAIRIELDSEETFRVSTMAEEYCSAELRTAGMDGENPDVSDLLIG